MNFDSQILGFTRRRLFVIKGRCSMCGNVTYKTRSYNNYRRCRCGVMVCDDCIIEDDYERLEHMDNCLMDN